MWDFLRPAAASAASDPFAILARLVGAWIAGSLVAFVYRRTRPAAAVLASFPGTLVLLAVLIAMVTQVIGDNVARAFSLVGALSIVRFRTVVRDTQDTAYVIFAVVVGMAVGASHVWVALAGTAVVTAAAVAMRGRAPAASTASGPYNLEVRLAVGVDPETVLGPVLDAQFPGHRLRGVSTGRQGLALDLSYEVVLPSGARAADLVSALNRLEGVQSVSLQRADVEV